MSRATENVTAKDIRPEVPRQSFFEYFANFEL